MGSEAVKIGARSLESPSAVRSSYRVTHSCGGLSTATKAASSPIPFS